MRIYVIGHRGYIGRSLYEYLENKGYDVRGIGRGHELQMGFKHTDVVVNCACAGWMDGTEDDKRGIIESNIILPMRLHDRSNGAVLIHLSSGIEDVQPLHFYSRTKGVASELLKGKAHVLYLYAVYGNQYCQPSRFMGSLMRACKDGTPYTIHTPMHTRDFVHIDTLLELIEGLLEDREFKTLHVGSGVPVRFVDALAHLESIAGKVFPNISVDMEEQSHFRYCAPEPCLQYTLREDMKKEWERLNA